MTLQNMLAAANILALLSILTFCTLYVRVPWWRSSLGRMLMLGAAAVGGLSAVGVIRRFDNRLNDGGLADWLTVGSTIAYLAVAATWFYKAKVVEQEGRAARADRDDR